MNLKLKLLHKHCIRHFSIFSIFFGHFLLSVQCQETSLTFSGFWSLQRSGVILHRFGFLRGYRGAQYQYSDSISISIVWGGVLSIPISISIVLEPSYQDQYQYQYLESCLINTNININSIDKVNINSLSIVLCTSAPKLLFYT